MREVPSWDSYFFDMAQLASTRSKDMSTNIGAVIVGPDNEVVSTGYNSFPRGLNDYLPERQERPEKYYWFEHGERNAIYNAARKGGTLLNCKIYLNCFVPCTDCARAIIQVGISEVILGTHHQSAQLKWLEAAKRSLAMFKEAGVKIRYPNKHEHIDPDQMIKEINEILQQGVLT